MNTFSAPRPKQSLGYDFQPGPTDVIIGRGARAFKHAGNIRFRGILNEYLDDYNAATSNVQKSVIVSKIVSQIRQASPNSGGFVKEDDAGMWYQMDDRVAREKVGQG